MNFLAWSGADAGGEIGEVHDPETHLIPNIIKAALHPTQAHCGYSAVTIPRLTAPACATTSMSRIFARRTCSSSTTSRETGFHAFNLGTGSSSFVPEVLAPPFAAASPRPKPHREGDPPVLVASRQAAEAELAGTRAVHSPAA